MNIETLRVTRVSRSRAAVAKRVLWFAVGAALLALLIIPSLLASDSGSPAGSSFSSDGRGIGAFAEVAKQFGHPVTQRRTNLASIDPNTTDPISSDATVVVLGSDLAAPEGVALASFVYGGGRLVTDVSGPAAWLNSVVGRPAGLTSDSGNMLGTTEQNRAAAQSADGVVSGPAALEPRVESGPVSYVPGGLGHVPLRVAGIGYFTAEDLDGSATEPSASGGRAEILAERSGHPIAASYKIGRGTVVVLADPTFLSNDLLDLDANAAFALSLIGEKGRPVVFAEESHGFGRSLTPSGIPARVKWFLGGLFGATLALMWTQGKRNGPPESPHRELAPPRSAYLRSLGAAVDRAERNRRFLKVK